MLNHKLTLASNNLNKKNVEKLTKCSKWKLGRFKPESKNSRWAQLISLILWENYTLQRDNINDIYEKIFDKLLLIVSLKLWKLFDCIGFLYKKYAIFVKNFSTSSI